MHNDAMVFGPPIVDSICLYVPPGMNAMPAGHFPGLTKPSAPEDDVDAFGAASASHVSSESAAASAKMEASASRSFTTSLRSLR